MGSFDAPLALPTLEEIESRVNAWSKLHDAKVLQCAKTSYRLLWEYDDTDRYLDIMLHPYDVSIDAGYRHHSNKQITALPGGRVQYSALETTLEDMHLITEKILEGTRKIPPKPL